MTFDLVNVNSFIERVEKDLGIKKEDTNPYPTGLSETAVLVALSSIVQSCAETLAQNVATEGGLILKPEFKKGNSEHKKLLRRANAIINCPDGKNTLDKLQKMATLHFGSVGASYIKIFYNSKGQVESLHHIPSSWVTHVRTEIDVPILIDSNSSKEDEKRAVIRDFDLYQITRVFNVVDSDNGGSGQQSGAIQTEYIYECHCPFENPSDIGSQTKQKLRKGKPYTRLYVFRNGLGENKLGVPFWIGEVGNLLALMAYDSLSHKMINNNLIPRLILMLGGAAFSKEQIEELKAEFETQLSGGSASQNTPLILNASGQKATQIASASEQPILPEISIHEIKNAFNPDSVKKFYDYVEDRVLKCFRIPRLLIGDTASYNRATADAALQVVEAQVFAPIRKEFDTFINTVILGNGFEESPLFTYKSKPMPIMPIDGELRKLTTLSNIGAITVGDATNLGQALVDIKLEDKSDEINQLPSAVVAKYQPTAGGATASAVDKAKTTTSQETQLPNQNKKE